MGCVGADTVQDSVADLPSLVHLLVHESDVGDCGLKVFSTGRLFWAASGNISSLLSGVILIG
ncbi:hypothetical protein GCM10028812_52860 [Ancylobacter sonchi]